MTADSGNHERILSSLFYYYSREYSPLQRCMIIEARQAWEIAHNAKFTALIRGYVARVRTQTRGHINVLRVNLRVSFNILSASRR